MDDARIRGLSAHTFPAGADYTPLLPHNRTRAAGGASFEDLLSKSSGRVSFSQHALQRLECRNISLTREEIEELDGAVERMADKGARTSLICMRDLAFVVSVPNRTVITAMDGASAKETVFTNIDSAAIL